MRTAFLDRATRLRQSFWLVFSVLIFYFIVDLLVFGSNSNPDEFAVALANTWGPTLFAIACLLLSFSRTLETKIRIILLLDSMAIGIWPLINTPFGSMFVNWFPS